MGRPYKNVDGRVAKALELIAGGLSERKACKAARVCRTTFHVRTRKYTKSVAPASDDGSVTDVTSVVDGTSADTVPNTTNSTSTSSSSQG
jgi:hypothetical protein